MGLKKSVKKLYFVDSSYDKRGHLGLEMPISHIILEESWSIQFVSKVQMTVKKNISYCI